MPLRQDPGRRAAAVDSVALFAPAYGFLASPQLPARGARVIARAADANELPPIPAAVAECCAGVSKGAKLLDVREVDEYAAAHFRSASPAPLSVLERGVFPEDRDTAVGIMLTQKIFVIGDALRAAKAASLLVHEMQYVDVTPLTYSFDELRALDIDDVLTGAPLSLSD